MKERVEIPIKVSFKDDGPFNASFDKVSKISTSNYEDLFNKPILNGNTIIGEKVSTDYGLQDHMNEATVAEIEAILYID